MEVLSLNQDMSYSTAFQLNFVKPSCLSVSPLLTDDLRVRAFKFPFTLAILPEAAYKYFEFLPLYLGYFKEMFISFSLLQMIMPEG